MKLNDDLSVDQVESALTVLGKGLCAIRLAAKYGEIDKCWALSDALHNLPTFIGEGGWTLEEFIEGYLEPVAEKYSEAKGWIEILRS